MAIYDASKLKNLKCTVKLLNGKKYLGKDICPNSNDLVFSFWDVPYLVIRSIPFSQIEYIEMFEGND